MEENKMVPELRFSEFTRNWTEVRLETICANFKSGNTLTAQSISEIGDYPVYGGNGLRGYTNSFTHDGHYLLIGRQGALCGNINIVKGKTYISEHAIAVSTNNSNDTLWLMHKLDYMNLNRFSESSAQPGLSVNKLLRIKIVTPPLKEQQKIAQFLSAVDHRIQLLEKRKEKLQAYKKGVMQQIFSQQIRFKQEDGGDFPEWEIIKGKDLFKNHSNKNHDSDLPILAASQEKGIVLRDENGINIKTSEASIKSYKVVEKGDFVISLRSFQGGIEYSNLIGICSPAYIILKPKKEIDDLFFKYYFKKESFIERLSKTVIGIRDGKQITYENFGGLRLLYPSINEQKKISSFLIKIDRKIDQTQTQIGKTKEFKKGLLQKMFV